MPKHLRSYIIRCWDLPEGDQRVEIEHIQSGKRIVVTSVASAVTWICDCDGAEPLSHAPEIDDSPGGQQTSALAIGGALTDRQR